MPALVRIEKASPVSAELLRGWRGEAGVGMAGLAGAGRIGLRREFGTAGVGLVVRRILFRSTGADSKGEIGRSKSRSMGDSFPHDTPFPIKFVLSTVRDDQNRRRALPLETETLGRSK